MHIIPDWKKVLRYAWTIRMFVLAGFFSGVEVILPYLEGYTSIPPGLFAALSGLTSGLGVILRFVAQKELQKDEQKS